MKDLLRKVARFYQQPNEARMGQVNQFVDKSVSTGLVNPLMKMAGSILFGNQIDPQALQTKEGAVGLGESLGMGLAGGMKSIEREVSQPIAKSIANLAIEKQTAGEFSFDAADQLVKLAKSVLKIKPKDMKYYSLDEIMSNLSSRLSKDQRFAYQELPQQVIKSGPVQPNPAIQAAKRYLRGMGGKFQGSLPKNLNIDTPLNIPKLF